MKRKPSRKQLKKAKQKKDGDGDGDGYEASP